MSTRRPPSSSPSSTQGTRRGPAPRAAQPWRPPLLEGLENRCLLSASVLNANPATPDANIGGTLHGIIKAQMAGERSAQPRGLTVNVTSQSPTGQVSGTVSSPAFGVEPIPFTGTVEKRRFLLNFAGQGDGGSTVDGQIKGKVSRNGQRVSGSVRDHDRDDGNFKGKFKLSTPAAAVAAEHQAQHEFIRQLGEAAAGSMAGGGTIGGGGTGGGTTPGGGTIPGDGTGGGGTLPGDGTTGGGTVGGGDTTGGTGTIPGGGTPVGGTDRKSVV